MRQQTKQTSAPATGRETSHTTLVDVLNDAVSTEIICWLRYSLHARCLSGFGSPGFSGAGFGSDPVSAAFSRYAEQELRHAIRAAERVSQCGGKPNFAPRTQANEVQTAYDTADDADAAGMLRENLGAERTMILAYREIIRRVGDRDAATRGLLESLLAEHEKHADDLRALLALPHVLQGAPWPRGSSPLDASALLERPAS